jgi:hypothetical protein
MDAPQSGSNLDLLLAGDNINLLSIVNGIVKKIKFSQVVILLANL